jgi:transcriptional regulator, AraC family
MLEEKLYIKNMVCNRCIMVVKSELEKLGISPASIILGEVTLSGGLSPEQKDALSKKLEYLGFALIDDKRARLIEQIQECNYRTGAL